MCKDYHRITKFENTREKKSDTTFSLMLCIFQISETSQDYIEPDILFLTGCGYLKKENIFEENTDILSPLSFL